MTEKRFIVVDYSTCVFDTITKEEYVCIDREEAFLVCNGLNNLAYENEQLKQREEKLLDEIGDFQNLLKQADDKIDYAVSIVKKTCPKEFVSKFKKKMWRWD